LSVAGGRRAGFVAAAEVLGQELLGDGVELQAVLGLGEGVTFFGKDEVLAGEALFFSWPQRSAPVPPA
jgi:hypothetical protein